MGGTGKRGGETKILKSAGKLGHGGGGGGGELEAPYELWYDLDILHKAWRNP